MTSFLLPPSLAPVLVGLRCCILRRAARVPDAFNGQGDIDLLVAREDQDALVSRLRGIGAQRGRLHVCHDNAAPNRQDWIVLDPDSGRLIHLDLHFGLMAGPRHAKHLPSLTYAEADLPPSTSEHTPLPLPAHLPVAPERFQHQARLIRAAFHPRALLPFGEMSVPEAPCAAQGGALQQTPVRTLWGLRRQLLRDAGYGPLRSLALWGKHLRALACYTAARLSARVGGTPSPRRRPETGGMVIALLGPDGMGKTSQLAALERIMSPLFDTRRFYLGSSGVISRIALARRGAARATAPSQDTAPASPASSPPALRHKAEDGARALWGLWLALYRFRTLRRARQLADRGYIVLCDRWPQHLERGLLDGPVRRNIHTGWRWAGRLFALEAWLYNRMARHIPDLTLHLTAPYTVAEARKPGELTPDNFSKRLALLDRLRGQRPHVIQVDTTAPFDQVHGQLLHHVWARMITPDRAAAPADPPAPETLRAPLNLAVAGQIAHTLGQLAVLTSISHLQGITAVGAFGLALSLVTPVFILANMGLRTTQAIDQEGRYSFAEYAGFRLLTIAAAFLICLTLGLALSWGSTVLPIILLYSCAKCFESLSGLSYGNFLRHERVDLVFRSFLCRAVATALVFFLLLWNGLPLWVAFLAQLGVWAAVALVLDLPAAWRLADSTPRQIRITRRTLRGIAARTLPIGGTGFLIGLQPALLRLMVENYFGLAALGVFTNITAVFQAGAMVSNAIRQFLSARFSRQRLRADMSATWHTVRTVSGTLLAICLIGVGLVLLAGDLFLHLAFGSETAAHQSLLLLVAFAMSFRILNAITSSLNHAYGHVLSLFWREAFYGLAVALLGWAILPQMGVIGAGVVLLVISSVRFLADGIAFAISQARIWHRKEG